MSQPWVISVDDHVVEPPNVWTDRLSARDRERGPRVVQNTVRTVFDPLKPKVTAAGSVGPDYIIGGEGPVTDLWVYEDIIKPITVTVASVGVPRDRHGFNPISYAEMRPGCFDPRARLADMDLNHVERAFCFPFAPRFAGQMFAEAKDKGLAGKCVAAYNDWMIEEWCGGSGGRLEPIELVPLWDAELAAQEVYRNAARGCRAVSFPEMTTYLGLPSIHDPAGYWDPFFRACDETGTVICMHIGSGSRLIEVSTFAPKAVEMTVASSISQVSMSEWLVSGLLVRFPSLKLCYAESQIGWIPYVLERLDNCFGRPFANISPLLEDVPSSYVPGRVYGCFFDDFYGVDNRHKIGVGQLLFETDYPHQDTTWPNTPDTVAAIAERAGPADTERIVRTNAIECFGLPARVPGMDAVEREIASAGSTG